MNMLKISVFYFCLVCFSYLQAEENVGESKDTISTEPEKSAEQLDKEDAGIGLSDDKSIFSKENSDTPDFSCICLYHIYTDNVIKDCRYIHSKVEGIEKITDKLQIVCHDGEGNLANVNVSTNGYWEILPANHLDCYPCRTYIPDLPETGFVRGKSIKNHSATEEGFIR